MSDSPKSLFLRCSDKTLSRPMHSYMVPYMYIYHHNNRSGRHGFRVTVTEVTSAQAEVTIIGYDR